uniref:Ion transport domain-containing protein n=1 Tax=Magallana gigas TaxID=29159 RepID=A0A8W8LBT2_MAGGI
MEASRFHWKPNDPEIVSDVLFAIANVISFARTTYLMPAFEVLGPLQISLGRMIGDITRFMVLFTLVLFAFMVVSIIYTGTMVRSELKWFLTRKPYMSTRGGFPRVSISDIIVRHPGPTGERSCVQIDGGKIMCTEEIRNESVYGGPTPESVNMERSTDIVEQVGMYLFALYHVVIIIVLINMLIAMMSHSFEDIQTDCDVEWKFARTKLWLNYMDEGSTLPVPFNMIPTPKSLCYAWRFCKDLLAISDVSWLEYQKNKKQTFIKKRRERVCKTLDLKVEDTSYSDIMQRLVKRYLFKMERAKDEKEIETNDTPPPVPDAPSRIPYATPIHEEDEDDTHPINKNLRSGVGSKRKLCGRSNMRRVSSSVAPPPTTLVIPQLDAIQRSQKLLDVRLQHLQANSKENNRIIDDIEFLRRVMTENQKALFNIIHALGNMQGEIVDLVKCLSSTPVPDKNHSHMNSSNSVSKSSGKKRTSHQDDEESEV